MSEIKNNMQTRRKHNGYWNVDFILTCPNTDCLEHLTSAMLPEIVFGMDFSGEVQCPMCGERFITDVSGEPPSNSISTWRPPHDTRPYPHRG